MKLCLLDSYKEALLKKARTNPEKNEKAQNISVFSFSELLSEKNWS